MSTHLQLANSTTMAILCGITILIVLLQPVIFMIVAFKRGKELNMTDQEMKEAARSSAIFSIIPSLPIIVSYLLLVPSLGRYFPWLRLSVVGSAAYETMVANMAAEALGLESITVPDIPADTFVFILFVVTIGILGGNIFNVFFLKAYDKKVESIKNSNAKLVPIITTAMFLGLYGTMAAPHFTNIANIPAVAAILVAGKMPAQARRLRIRVNGPDGKKYFAHTLNNTVVAPPRMLIAFLENNLQADGSVRIPEVLRPYMGGKTEIK